MRERKNVLLLFSKLPEPGLVKTRLSTLKDGILTPENASWLYHCMLFDVTEICCAALADLEAASLERTGAEGGQAGDDVGLAGGLVSAGGIGAAGSALEDDVRDTYELVVSTTPAQNVDKMRGLYEASGAWPRHITFACDSGASFDEHYNDAFSQAWKGGASTILSIGCDMPALTRDDIIRGFDALHGLDELESGGIVYAPDQEMGVSAIGWTRSAQFDHTGVFYNQSGLTVLPAYIQKARERNLPAVWLPPIPDVDTVADLTHNITLVEALCYSAEHDSGITPPWRTHDALVELGMDEVRVPPNDLMDPRDDIDV